MKKKFSMFLAAMLFGLVSIHAQSVKSVSGDMNADGVVDVADIVAVIDIMQKRAFFYMGTVCPTADNYMSLPGVITSFISFDDASGTTISVPAGETLYMMCPSEWLNGKSVVLKDGNGNVINFLKDIDTESVQGYAIYKTDAWDSASEVSLVEANTLLLSSTTIKLMTGFGGAVRIVAGSGNYDVKSSNEDIATASIAQLKDSTYAVYISAVNAGEATISITDNVSNVTETVFVAIQDDPEQIQGDYVDMGLPSGTLWATCNIGSDTPEGEGWHVSWGEIEEKTYYSWSNYYLFDAGNTTDLNDGQDVACVKLGKGWRMPTMAELEELLTCSWSWEKYNDVQGARVTGPNGKSIFLPAVAFKDDYYGRPAEGTYGSYWGRTHASPTGPCGAELVFGTADYKTGFSLSNFYFEMGPTGWCMCGRSVRPVYDATYNPNIPQNKENDYTSYIANANYNNNNYSGWDGTSLSGYGSANNAEHYNRNYDTYQTISGLPKGTYRVGVQGFYRKGNYDDDYSFWTSGDTDGNAMLYATSSIASVSTPLARVSSAALTESLGDRSAVVGNNMYIPDDMNSAGAWFAAGYYQNYLSVKVDDDGILVIGIKKDTLVDRDWTIIDNWTLFRIGE